jgi:hypothetical protein
MKDEIFYNNIQKALENLPDNFNILEEQIDIEIQMQYFEFIRESRENYNPVEIFENREELFLTETTLERKKEILAVLSVIDDVKAYRTIEKFLHSAEGFIKHWSILALQESRMLLQSSLLDEQQVFISTGLGGKGQKLRYFVVFLGTSEYMILNKTQRKLLKDEVVFELKKNDGVFESIDFIEGFSTALVMLPLKADIRSIFRNIIDECNQYGNFLKVDLIVTNVKIMSKGEILDLLNKKEREDELEEE